MMCQTDLGDNSKMKKTLWDLLLTLPIFMALVLLVANAKAFGQETPSEFHPDIRAPELLKSFDPSIKESKIVRKNQLISQNLPQTTPTAPTQPSSKPSIPSVSELSDVQPTDWAFQALQSLVERYGCIVGYPNSTYRGNRALTRYEFAAGLNACLDQINTLVASSTADLATKEDLATIQRLTEEFRPELAKLAGRIDNLEAKTAQVEANQFSTTTKLLGNAIFVVADTFGARPNNTPANDTKDPTNTLFAYLSRLSLQSSFTGKDQLVATLRADNIPNLTSSTGTSMTRFALDASTFGDSNLYVENLYYRFPVGQKLTFWIGPRTLNFPVYVPTLNSLNGNPYQGGFSRFGQFNPTVYRPGFDGAGGAVAYKFSDQLQAHVAYIADDPQANRPESGLFKSSFAAIAQAAGANITYIAGIAPTPAGSAVLVPKNSPIKSVTDLKGKKIAFQKGSSAHYLLLKILDKSGLKYSDIQPVYLPPADARAAFVKGSLDAWVIWDPFYAAAEKSANARVLIDGAKITNQGGYYLASRTFATENPQTIKSVLEEIKKLDDWSNKNKDQVAATLAPVLGIDLDIMKRATQRKNFGVVPINENLIAEQQKVADTFYQLKLIPKQINVRNAMLTPQQYAAFSPKI